ncbi:MAG: hypothetical protein COU06_01865 [Candidatus Harrisonbacteria bacterium CG10_big_fil_rev_8_21_14_0_10_38_8]|uniref:LemA family protein n=1 Tax=Candidatus Harrisonbacteria bacterium CG10_big_fil_rev_8_21_14_0_10_38_8 TaxID=1974582 RepID=A0A2M6WJZ6_9BACT|nr:MAG: hypothetical protein COU06_01865 [Candidatus Harrisonbacteria bacterium CG10_big_fil_rev_8_21_14_0_10_38_8]
MIILIIVAILLVILVSIYNRLVKLRNRMREATSDIEVQAKRRYDLIPNLIEAVKGYMAQERGVLESVTNARANAMGAQGSTLDKADAENQFTSTLKTLFAVSENYPDLKSNTNFLELQRELSDTENKMMAARRFYNDTVNDLNTAVETFPTNIFASIFGFKVSQFFKNTTSEENEPVKVSF